MGGSFVLYGPLFCLGSLSPLRAVFSYARDVAFVPAALSALSAACHSRQDTMKDTFVKKNGWAPFRGPRPFDERVFE